MANLQIVAVVVALLSSTALSLAQNQSPAPPPNAQTQAPPPTGGGDAQQNPVAPDVAELKKFLQDQVAHAQELEKRQGEVWDELQKGTENFDVLISDFQRLIDIVGPSSEFAKSMERLIARFEERAKWAAGHQNPEIRALTEEFQKNVQDARDVLAQGIATADAARGTLNALKSNKEVLIARWELVKGRDMIARYRAAIDILKRTNERLQDIANKAGTLPKPVPTQ